MFPKDLGSIKFDESKLVTAAQTPSIVDGITADGVYFQWYRSPAKIWSPPLVMIMGYGGNLATFTTEFMTELAMTGDVIAFDHLGSGKSKSIERGQSVTFADYALHVAHLIDELELPRVNLLGYSMGGCIALEFMHRHGSRVDKLILQSTTSGGKYYHKADPEIAERMQNPRGSTFDEMYFDFMSISMPAPAIETHRQLLQRVCDITSDPATPIHVLQMKMDAFRQFDGSDYLPSIKQPTLVIHGDEDQLLKIGNGRDMAAAIPNSQLLVVENCGHYPHIEYRDQVVETINSFLR